MKKQLTPHARRFLIAFGACWAIGGLGALVAWDNARYAASAPSAPAAVATPPASAEPDQLADLQREAGEALERYNDPAHDARQSAFGRAVFGN